MVVMAFSSSIKLYLLLFLSIFYFLFHLYYVIFIYYIERSIFILTGFYPIQAKRPKVDAITFDSVLSHTRRSDASGKREENSVSTFGRLRR